jgi:NodT family efflux transporter outer membrane factor (OMF) lipoprotein
MIARRAGPALALAAVLLGGCTVGPRYTPPAPPAPASPTFAAAAPADVSADQPPGAWWRLYDTPALDQLVQQAQVHNKSLLAAAANLAEARGALSLARAGLYPSTSISAVAQYGVSPDQVFASQLLHEGTPSPGAYYNPGLDVSYELDLFGRIHQTIAARKANLEAVAAAEDVTRVSVAGETTRAFVNACAYAAERDVAERLLTLAIETTETTIREARDGGASALDVARAREQEAQIRATLPTYEDQRRTALFQLAVLTGDPPEMISKAADDCRAPPKLTRLLPVGDIQSLFRRRPDVREAERQLASNVALIDVATADLYPTITLNGSVSSAASSLSGLGALSNLSYLAGPALSWSFPNTLTAQAEIQQAKGTASASYANFQAVVLQALQDTETALTDYTNELARNAALITARDQSQTAFDLARKQYRDGSISYLNLIIAQNDLVGAEETLATSDQVLASDQVTLFKALGGGWEQAPPVTAPPIVDGKSGKSIPVR